MISPYAGSPWYNPSAVYLQNSPAAYATGTYGSPQNYAGMGRTDILGSMPLNNSGWYYPARGQNTGGYNGYNTDIYTQTIGSMPRNAQGVTQASQSVPWTNRLKSLFHKKQSIIYALNIRTFGANDPNRNGKIDFSLGESGTFLSSIAKLDELKDLGVNTIHLLPINPVGKLRRLGEAGSIYAPSDYHHVNPEFRDPTSPLSAMEQGQLFIKEAHKRGIHVMVDIPSCASIDLATKYPQMKATDSKGNSKTPANWIDIVMFKNDQNLVRYFQGFFDLMVDQLGVDGFRVDVARARPVSFWKHFINKYPDKAWLAESYIEEDVSPMQNVPRDIPETFLKVGFDALYGQFHIFPAMSGSKEYYKYMAESADMFRRTGMNKSFIGTFLTHDDPSLFERGGVPISILSAGMMMTQPWTNPYILDGFTTGYNKPFDIFNYSPRPMGKHPEIGRFVKRMITLRTQYQDILTQGSFVPIDVKGNKQDQIIAFARQLNGRTLLMVANKDINARQTGTLNISGLQEGQVLRNLAPEFGQPSRMKASMDKIAVDLGPARFHVFEIQAPRLAGAL